MGTVVDNAVDFYGGRLTNAERKGTLTEQLLVDTELTQVGPDSRALRMLLVRCIARAGRGHSPVLPSILSLDGCLVIPLQARKKRFNKLQENAQKFTSVKKRKTDLKRIKKNVKHKSR